ncbi:hypothetical protein [Nocardia arizonensis]|uniref:hypothetical protein n=1 Tax=Nocardia arizonensis TaxID=1141647 RepID=UPI0012E26FFB|nr:hypothetical protein [Nocardia arizonensis]
MDKTKVGAEELRTKKAAHEHWCAVLRKAGRSWNMRYSSVDYVNLPRISMQTDGLGLHRIANEVGLDPTRPFKGQGFAVGMFVHRIQPIFENWNEQAVRLDIEHADVLTQGLTVAFGGPMHVVNLPKLPPRPITGSWARDPYLTCALGDRVVKIRFDPEWLTTATATTDLDAAQREPIEYAGLGVVVGVSETEIKVSARLFGQPKSPIRGMFEYARLGGQHELDLADFADELSGSTANDVAAQLQPIPMTRHRVVLHFDEDRVVPMQIEKEVFRRLLRVVPEYRRELTVTAAFSLTAMALQQTRLSPAKIALEAFDGASLWKAMSVPAFDNMIRQYNVAAVVISGLTIPQGQDLHDLFRRDVEWYLGALEYVADKPIHRRLYEFPTSYKILETDLHILYSAADSAFSDDELPDDLIDDWTHTGLFRTVEWEEDLERSERDEAEARQILEMYTDYGAEHTAPNDEPMEGPGEPLTLW